MGGFVERTGIEPVLPGWKPEVLTVRRTLRIQICHSGRKNKGRRFLAQIFLIYILKKGAISAIRRKFASSLRFYTIKQAIKWVQLK